MDLGRFFLEDVSRCYFHQVNGKLLSYFAEGLGVPMKKVAMNVDWCGNLSAASTLVMLDRELHAKKDPPVKKGDLCLFCTVGAYGKGAQFGAILLRL